MSLQVDATKATSIGGMVPQPQELNSNLVDPKIQALSSFTLAPTENRTVQQRQKKIKRAIAVIKMSVLIGAGVTTVGIILNNPFLLVVGMICMVAASSLLLTRFVILKKKKALAQIQRKNTLEVNSNVDYMKEQAEGEVKSVIETTISPPLPSSNPTGSQIIINEISGTNYSSTLCIDIFHYIFSLTRADLSACASVSRKWKEMAYHPRLHQIIFPKNYCGSAKWVAMLGLMAPIREPSIPLDFYSFFDESAWQLILVPDHFVKEQEIIDTNNINSLRSFFENLHIEGLSFSGVALSTSEFSERTRWIAYRINVIGRHQDFETQQNTAKTIARGAHIPRLVDMLMICFREKLRTGEFPFHLETGASLRVDEKWCNKKSHQSISFINRIEYKGLNVGAPYDTVQRSSLAVVPILKTYGRGIFKNMASKPYRPPPPQPFTFSGFLKDIKNAFNDEDSLD
jgi:hypothetical protein